MTCNNIKSTTCRRCPLDYRCESCTWAHPEKHHDAVVLRLSPEQAADLVEIAGSASKDPRAYAEELFREALDAARGKHLGSGGR